MNFTEHYFTEALSNELMHLKRYLEMSNEDKAMNRAFSNPYMVKEYLEEEGKSFDEIEDMEEDYEIVEWLSENDPETLVDYGEYLVGQKEYYDSSEPELYDIVDYRGFVRQKWMVHFSDRADEIAADQNFKIGVPYEDYNRLALSTYFKDISKTGGFNFAYEADDVRKYAFERGTPKYGKEAVLFKGDGIKVWHEGDIEEQVIYDGLQTKKPIIHIQYDGDKWFVESTVNGEKIVEKDTVNEIADWVEQNYAQYRKHLEP